MGRRKRDREREKKKKDIFWTPFSLLEIEIGCCHHPTNPTHQISWRGRERKQNAASVTFASSSTAERKEIFFPSLARKMVQFTNAASSPPFWIYLCGKEEEEGRKKIGSALECNL